MIVIHMDHEKLTTISKLWCKRYPARWARLQAVANLLDVPLFSLIYQRLRELQDAAAREAFERKEDFTVVTWEWREVVVKGRLQSHTGHTPYQPAGIIQAKTQSAENGGEWPRHDG